MNKYILTKLIGNSIGNSNITFLISKVGKELTIFEKESIVEYIVNFLGEDSISCKELLCAFNELNYKTNNNDFNVFLKDVLVLLNKKISNKTINFEQVIVEIDSSFFSDIRSIVATVNTKILTLC